MSNKQDKLGSMIVSLIIILAIVFVLFIIGISITENVLSEKNARSASTDTSLTISDKINTKAPELNPNNVLEAIRRANGKSIEEAYDIYRNERQFWNTQSPEISKHLIEYFDSYFELRLALFFCIDNKKTIRDVVKLHNDMDWNDKESTKKAKKELRENDYYNENKYLLGEKTFNKGLVDCITYISDLEAYMQRYKEVHAEIPAADLLMMTYQYLFEIDKKNENIQFINLTLNYESTIMRKIHKSSLTEKDVLVLELKESYRLIQAASENNETKRKKDCTDIINEIDRMFNEFSNDISEQGSYKEAFAFLDRVKRTAMDIQQSVDGWGKNEDQKAAIEWLKKKNNIPYMI